MVATLLQQGCSSFAMVDSTRKVHQTEIFYGTDRELVKSEAPGVYYGPDRGDVSYGVAKLDVWSRSFEIQPTNAGLTRATIAEPTETLLKTTRRMSKNEFFEALNSPDYSGRPGEVLLFVHGFKRDFITAAENAAQLSDSIGFQGRTVFWSWPSQNNPAAYLADRTSLLWSELHLAKFITDLVEQAGIRRLVLVAHSLGAQGLVQALAEGIGAEKLDDWNVIEQLALMAPDIDLAIFQRDIVPEINAAGIPTTLYASANDRALITSTTLNGFLRAGDSSQGVHIFEGIDTIDVTLAKQSFLGHSYYSRSFAVIDDLRRMIVKRQPATIRPGLVRTEIEGRFYWKLE